MRRRIAWGAATGACFALAFFAAVEWLRDSVEAEAMERLAESERAIRILEQEVGALRDALRRLSTFHHGGDDDGG